MERALKPFDSNANVSTSGLYHYPATITNSSIATQIATFDPSGQFTTTTTAAVINKIGARQQMVWFTSWATDFSQTSNYLQHAYIHWMTRGLCKPSSFFLGYSSESTC